MAVMTTIATEENAPTKRLTAEEVLRMAEAGMFDEGEAVELLEGDLVVVTPQGPAQVGVLGVIAALMEGVLPDDTHLRHANPILADRHSLRVADLLP